MTYSKILVCTAFALAAASTQAAAPLPLALNQTIVSRISGPDMPSFKAAVLQALNAADDGQKVQWTGKPKRNNSQISATMESLKTITTSKGNKCRFLYTKVTEMQRSEDWRFWFCQQESGGWRVSGA